MTTPVNANDPRVKRTRQLLLEAFITLLEEKHNIYSISVQDITERANLNRATFYAHFEDKYAFLESWVRMKCHRALESQLPASSALQIDTLRTLIVATFDFLAKFRANFRRYMKPSDKQFEPLFEVALQKELYEVLLNWLKGVPSSVPVLEGTLETTALVISWAIFGSAVQWSREEQTCSTQEITCQVLTIVVAGLSPIIPIT